MQPAEPRLLNRFATFVSPLLLTNTLQVLSGTLVNAYLGQTLGTNALATASAVFPVMIVIHSLLNGFGLGASVLCGQAWGAKDETSLRSVAGTGVAGLMCFAIAMVIFAALAMPALMTLLGVPLVVRSDAILYGRLAVLNALSVAPTLMTMALLRSTGNTAIGFRGLVVYCIVLVVATPLLVNLMGVNGAPIASGVAITANLAWNLWDMQRIAHPLAWPRLRGHLRLEWPRLAMVLRIGVPGSIFGFVASVADMLVITLVNLHGAQASAAWGVVLQVSNWVLFPTATIAIAASTFAAQAIGAGRLHEIDELTRAALGIIVVLGGCLAALFTVAAPYIVGLFLVDPPAHEIGVKLLRLSVWANLLMPLAMVFSATMRAAGTVMTPTALYVGCFALILYPAANAFDGMLGVQGVWLAYAVTNLAALALQAGYFFGFWRGRPIVKLV